MGWQSRGALCLWICIIISNFNEGLSSCENGMFHCDNDNCVMDVYKCDKENDCGDWSDEKNCTFPTTPDAIQCDHGEWGCVDNTICISLSQLCDGEQDCLDNSDEDDLVCHEHRGKCEDGHFVCKNSHCILEEWVCDGEDDCHDNSDEVGCLHHNTTLACTVANHFFKCNTGPTCIELQKVCDGENHCQDNSDEGPGCNSSRALCPHFGCDDECYALPTETVCTCKSGYDLVNNKKCRDIDECSTYGLCDQRCKNTPGSYECDCVEGYERRGNKCEAEGGEPLLLIARKNDIRAYYLKSGVRYTVTDNTDHAVGIAYDGKSVYWTNLKDGEEAIFRSDEHGINPQPIMVSGLEQPETLAIDWITGNIYFTDDGPKHIAACTHDAKMCTVLVNENIGNIRGLVLLIAEGRMFWSDWGENPTISEACMDGTDRKVFVAKDLQWPNGLALDYGNYRLYWADAKLGTLESIRLDGSDRRVILKGVVKHPYSVAVFEDRLYWSDWDEREVKSCHKFTGKNMTVIAKSSRSMIYNIQVYHSAAHPEIPNPCVNSLCSDMCLLSNHTAYSCACPPHKQLGNDKHICRDMDNIEEIVVASVHHLYIIEHQVLGKQTITEMNLHNVYTKAMTYNSLKDELVIYDSDNMKIITVDIRSRQISTLLSPVKGIEAMDFDYLGNNLYWCNKIFNTVEVMSLFNGYRTVLIQYPTDTDPLSLAVVPEEGLMFVAVNSGPNLFIERMHMDGKGERTHIIDQDLVGPYISLSYDPTLHRIFWTDMGRGIIESTGVDGIDRHELQVFAAQPVYIAILGRHVFWTNLDIRKLYWTDKFNGMSKVKKLPLNIDAWEPGFYPLAAITGKRASHAHICQHHNGGCSHICLLALKNVECACPAGQTLDNTNKTCLVLADCKYNQFKCVADNLCISILYRCDGKKDCPSGADEDMCPHCGKDEFQCKNGFCVKSEQKCDGNFDCDDYSDESECDEDCSSAMMFPCKSGGCVPKSHRCDGAMDCSDGSDEADCQRDCSESQFKCKKSERCIPKQWECDGEYDCDDQSDEHFDCTPPTCSPKEFSCRNGHCVDKILHCNGVDECGDGSDELHCWDHHFNKTVPHCTEDHYICKFNTTICLPRSARCNGTVECPKGEDEMDCGCLEDEFECQNGRCIPLKWVCDSSNDCGDSSDEHSTLCAHWGRTPDAGTHSGRCPEFSCLTTGQCVPLSSVCNKENDCLDGSDEGGKCDTSCEEATLCQQVCHKTPFGSRCSCKQGFEELSDGKSCLDIDECSLSSCSQLCINTVGSYMCDCLEGYVLRSDKTSCKASGEPMEFIYTAFNQIRKLKPRSNTMGIVLNGQDLQITGLDVDVINRTVYWSYEVTGTVNRISVDGHNKVTIGNVGHPTKLAVDWVTKNVYVIDEDNVQRLKVCNLDVKKCSVLLEMEKGSKITSIAVDPLSGLLIWSQAFWGKLKKPISELHSCDLSGRNRKMIAKDISFVNGIALDLSNKRLFWIDERSKLIETIRYDGENRHIVTTHAVILAKGLVQFEGFLHWLTKGSDYITKFRLYGQTNYQRIPIHVHNSELFTILQTARQPRRPNKCENVTCSHLCVLNVGNAQCICPDGTLVEEQQHCIGKKDKTIHIVTPDYEAHASGNTAVIVVMILLLILVVLGSVYWFFFYRKRPVRDLNIRLYFNDSIDRIRESLNIKAWKKGESDETEHEYVNPLMQAEHAVAISESSEATCKKAPKAVKFTKQKVGMTPFENDSDDETDETDNAYLIH